MEKPKLKECFDDLQFAFERYTGKFKDPREERLAFLSLTKAFEIGQAYLWKDLKKRVESEGLEAQSPKSALREAVKLGLLKPGDEWFRFVDARNMAAHDYYGITKNGFLDLVKLFLAHLDGYLE